LPPKEGSCLARERSAGFQKHRLPGAVATTALFFFPVSLLIFYTRYFTVLVFFFFWSPQSLHFSPLLSYFDISMIAFLDVFSPPSHFMIVVIVEKLESSEKHEIK
jgi:hypothetical protein